MSARSGKPADPESRGSRAHGDSIDAASEPRPVASNTRTFGKYKLLAELGRGGMADVHLAVAVGPAGFSKLQVIKRLRPGMTDEAEMQSMMLDEARLAARLNHKNIVQTNEVGIVDDRYFLAMEYLDGQPYHRILKRVAQLGRTIPLPFAVKILCEVLSGLHYAHELKDYDGHPLGVVHRDVSPQNVFVTYDGQVKVVDFGIAKHARRLVETQTGIIRGKITYMAPEQAFANEVDRRADVFSVGVLLWEAIAGERLWGQLSDPEIVARLMHEVPSVTTVRPDAPVDLVDLSMRALARDAATRPATAAEMRGELEGYLATHDIQVSAEALGALVIDLFREERDELQRLIDRELALLRQGDDLERSDIAVVPRHLSELHKKRAAAAPAARPSPRGLPAPMRIPGLTPLPPAVRDAATSRPADDTLDTGEPISPRPPDSLSGPTIPRAPAFERDEGMTARELSPPVAVLSNAPGPPSSTTIPTAPAWGESSRWRHPIVYVAAACIAASVAVVVGKAGFSTASAPSGSAAGANTTTAPPSAATTSAPVTPAAATTAAPVTTPAIQSENNYVRLRITTNPVDSKILVDGSPLPPSSGPFEGKFMKDGAVHRITVEASGFYPQSRMVVFDKDQQMDFFLHSKKGLPPPKDSPYH